MEPGFGLGQAWVEAKHSDLIKGTTSNGLLWTFQCTTCGCHNKRLMHSWRDWPDAGVNLSTAGNGIAEMLPYDCRQLASPPRTFKTLFNAPLDAN